LKKTTNNIRNSNLKEFRKNLPLTIMALPALVTIFVMYYIPLYGLLIPFVDFNIRKGLFKSKFVGLNNFKYLLSSDMLMVLRNTLLYNLVFIVVGTIASLAFALMLFELGRRSVKFYQTALFFPFFMSWVVVSYLFLGLLDADHGLINQTLKLVGINPVTWYSTLSAWPFILVFAAVWKGLGYGTVIYYAGLMGIDKELLEASKLDGTNWFQQVWYISIPMLKPLIVILNIMAIGKIFYSDFGLFYQIPMDLPTLYPVTDVFDTYVFRMLRRLGDFGMSSAAGFVQSVCGFILVVITNHIVKKTTKESLF
jgi:putative aldouronate transport system permease protein